MALAENMAALSDQSLVRRSRLGDVDAFNKLVLQYQNLAYYYAYAILGDPMLADDATQESFIKAFQNIQALRSDAFRAWLLKIVTNTSISLLRSQIRRRSQPLTNENDDSDGNDSPSWMADPSPSVEMTVEHNECFRQVYRILDSLPAIHRTVLTLIDVYEMGYEEASDILRIPIGTVKSRLARARYRAKTKLLEDAEFTTYYHHGDPVISSRY